MGDSIGAAAGASAAAFSMGALAPQAVNIPATKKTASIRANNFLHFIIVSSFPGYFYDTRQSFKMQYELLKNIAIIVKKVLRRRNKKASL
jgi:hypothetical protein